jgi:hypothetical protein
VWQLAEAEADRIEKELRERGLRVSRVEYDPNGVTFQLTV